MNLENFAEILDHPSRLYQLNYQELKNLVLAYPYNANLRVLLWLKARQIDDPKADHYLQRAAAYTFDRAKLYQLHRQLGLMPAESLSEAEERLELRDLTDLHFDLEPLPAEARPEADTTLAWQLPVEEITGFRPEPDDRPEAVDVPLTTPSTPTSAAPTPPPPGATPPTSAPAPDKLKRFQRLVESHKQRDLAALSGHPAPPPPAREKPHKVNTKAVEQFARRSVEASDNLVSETLARLLIEQGLHQRALRMYEKLLEVYPEKAADFLPLIETLRQKS